MEIKSIKTNINTIERIVRVVFGILIAAVAIWREKTPWAFLGLIPIITGILGFCPLYEALGISTEKQENLVGKVRKMVRID